MKLKNYQVDAIVDTVCTILKNKRNQKFANIKNSSIKKYIDSYDRCNKLRKQKSALEEEINNIEKIIADDLNVSIYDISTYGDREAFINCIKNIICSEQFKINIASIKNKIIIKDLSNNFDVDTLIKEIVSEYEEI